MSTRTPERAGGIGLDLISLFRKEPSLQPLRTSGGSREPCRIRLEGNLRSFLMPPPFAFQSNLISWPNLNNLRFGVDGEEGGSLDGIPWETASRVADTNRFVRETGTSG